MSDNLYIGTIVILVFLMCLPSLFGKKSMFGEAGSKIWKIAIGSAIVMGFLMGFSKGLSLVGFGLGVLCAISNILFLL